MKPYRPGHCAQCGQVKHLRTWLLIAGRRQGRLCDECAAVLGGGDNREGRAKVPLVAQKAKEAARAAKGPRTRKPRSRRDFSKPEVVVRGEA